MAKLREMMDANKQNSLHKQQQEQESLAERNKITESQLRIREFAASAKRIFAEDQLFAEVERINTIGLTEAMKFRMDGKKHERVKTNYPKTNLKRQADDWNNKVAGWADEHKNMGCQLLKRDGTNPLVVDAVDKEGLMSTLVVTNQGESHNDMTIDVYNQRSGAKNKYSEDVEHAGPWKYKDMDIGDLHSSDQRNVSTSKNDQIKTQGRKKDGQSLQALAKSSRK